MDIRDRRALKQATGASLSRAAYDPKKLILLHTGVILLLSAVLTAVDYLLERMIGATGGLSGMGTRSVLETVQSMLMLVQTTALPFWQMGYTFVVLKLSRQEQVGPSSLLEGFRRFGPVLRLTLLQSAIYLGIGIACSYASCVLVFATPWGASVMEELLPLMSDPAALDPAALEAAVLTAMEALTVPLLVIFGILFLAVCAPVHYHYRMAGFALMDQPENGALSALRTSRKRMRRHCIELFKLDLSFWWFYLLDGLVTVACYGDVLLTLVGIELPVSAEVGDFLFFGLYLLCQLALYWWRRNEVEVTYAHAYAALSGPREPSRQPEPQSRPWN